MTELKNLQCHGMTTMGTALKHVFDLLNINRIQSGIDTYGSGRCPYFLEPVVIVVITDGGRLTNSAGVQDEVNEASKTCCFKIIFTNCYRFPVQSSHAFAGAGL